MALGRHGIDRSGLVPRSPQYHQILGRRFVSALGEPPSPLSLLTDAGSSSEWYSRLY